MSLPTPVITTIPAEQLTVGDIIDVTNFYTDAPKAVGIVEHIDADGATIVLTFRLLSVNGEHADRWGAPYCGIRASCPSVLHDEPVSQFGNLYGFAEMTVAL